jgi:hypothetical protein
MSAPSKPSVVPGVIAALPLAIQPFLAMAFVLQAGGLDQIRRGVERAGMAPYVVLGCAGLAALGLCAVLYRLASGRQVPLVAPVGLALVPWLVGSMASLHNGRDMLVAIAAVDRLSQFTIFTLGTGDVLYPRWFGAWATAGLLLATTGGLVLAALGRIAPRAKQGEPRASPRLLEAGAVLVLSALSLLSTIEAASLYETLSATANVNPADKATILANGTYELQGTLQARTVMRGALALAAALLVGWQLWRRPRDTAGLTLLALLVLWGGSVVWADGRPLSVLAREVERRFQPSAELAGMRLLPLGSFRSFDKLEIVATPEGVSRPGGTVLPWDAGHAEHVRLLKEATGAMEGSGRRLPQRHLELALDARLPASALRRLLLASADADVSALYLLSEQSTEARRETLRALPQGCPLLVRLVAADMLGPGVVEIFMASVLAEGGFSSAPLWKAKVGTEPQLRLEHESGTRVWDLRAPDSGDSFPELNNAMLYLTFQDEASLEDVAHAVRKAQAQGLHVTLAP